MRRTTATSNCSIDANSDLAVKDNRTRLAKNAVQCPSLAKANVKRSMCWHLSLETSSKELFVKELGSEKLFTR